MSMFVWGEPGSGCAVLEGAGHQGLSSESLEQPRTVSPQLGWAPSSWGKDGNLPL